MAGICGAGDFAITAVMAGAQSFAAIDISSPQTYLAELRTLALNFLSREQFRKACYLQPKTYGELRNGLSEDARNYLDTIIVKASDDSKRSHAPELVPYLQNDETYATCRRALTQIYFHQTGAVRFLESSNEQLDGIYLSNIYCSEWLGREIALDCAAQQMHNKLALGGIVLCAKLFPYNDAHELRLKTAGFRIPIAQHHPHTTHYNRRKRAIFNYIDVAEK
jgi:hypothetical protein